jgi:serine/threonine protein kinase
LRNLKRKTSVVINQPAKEFRIDDFELLDKIGKGAFGDVFLAQEKVTGLMVVLKKLQKKKIIEKKLEEQLIREIKIQSFLQHRHLTSIYGFFSDESCIYLILEVMPDGSLMQVRKKRKIE